MTVSVTHRWGRTPGADFIDPIQTHGFKDKQTQVPVCDKCTPGSSKLVEYYFENRESIG